MRGGPIMFKQKPLFRPNYQEVNYVFLVATAGSIYGIINFFKNIPFNLIRFPYASTLLAHTYINVFNPKTLDSSINYQHFFLLKPALLIISARFKYKHKLLNGFFIDSMDKRVENNYHTAFVMLKQKLAFQQSFEI